ncbi:hypothetical protein ACFVMC_28720 [Nocardia sp. NPDC127579]
MASGPGNHDVKDGKGAPLEEFQITAEEAARLARAFKCAKADR